MPSLLAWAAGDDAERRARLKTRLVQVLIVVNVVLGTRYITWRIFHSVNWALWPLALALLSAELFSYIDSLLFAVNMWRVRARGEPPAAPAGLTVDVFVTTYNEPVDMVLATAAAARDIRYPHRTYVLDDGDRLEMRAAAASIGVGYLVRHAGWHGKDRHAKAGNLINAMAETTGAFLLILDADQVPRPQLLDRVLGYFDDEDVALVQTPQWFGNTPPGDPFGTDAPLFYGPIQAGKDGWNSAFFCGSNAVLRREALMHLGVVWYARDLDRSVRHALRAARPLLRRAQRRLVGHPRARAAVREVLALTRAARRSIGRGLPLQAVTWDFQRAVERVSRRMVTQDFRAMLAELMDLPGELPQLPRNGAEVIHELARRDQTPVGVDRTVRGLLQDLDLDRADEAEPVLPMSTVSVTEDMATAMRLHGLGWQTVYHHEILAVGLAPEDLQTALQQRLRWAQGTLQVLFRENPLWQPGLSWPQRLLYFGTMWSYLSGFAIVVYLAAPVLFLCFGLVPITAYSAEFFGYLLPWLAANQLLFVVIGWGIPTWRGMQYSTALFPLWIKAVATTIGNTWFGRPLGFVVTSKSRSGPPTALAQLRLVWPQVVAMALLCIAIVVGAVRWSLGEPAVPLAANMLWAVYDLVLLSVMVTAATYRPDAVPEPEPGQ